MSNPLTDPLFLSVADMKKICPMSDNVGSGAPLLQCIRQAQTQYVEPYLGREFYAQLIAQTAAYQATPSTPYPAATQAIIEMLQAMQAQYALALFLPIANARLRDVGVVNQTGQNTTGADVNWMQEQIRKAESAAETYKDRLTAYMFDSDNQANYPLFVNQPSFKGGPRNGIMVIAPPEGHWNMRYRHRRPW